jgi:hypothetical protein
MRVGTTPQKWTYGISLIGYLALIEGCWRIIPMPVTHPIEALAREIEKAISAELFYLALLLTLTLPDICAALEQPDGRANKKFYIDWYNKNIFQKIGGLTAEEARELRNTVVHQSHAMASKKRKYTRIIFTMPTTQYTIDSMILNDAMTFNVDAFCKRWLKCVRDWIDISKSDSNVQVNLPWLLQIRPSGLPPYIVGQPIIA